MKNRDCDQGLIKKVNLLQNLLTLFFVSGRKAARTPRAEASSGTALAKSIRNTIKLLYQMFQNLIGLRGKKP